VSTIPRCDLTDEDVDDCHCVEADYDDEDAADERYQQELDARE
jgi:hypothetical protein